jgi:histidyl-tRNA synthetase
MQVLRGMRDVLPPESLKWQHLERIAGDIFSSFGYILSITPVLESTDLFCRSIGENTDVVSKEMYTFKDKGDESVTLRPEGTASIMRAYLASGELYGKLFKTWYWGPMFRYERPQKGRFRQFYQFGLEAIGADSPYVDAELIFMLDYFYKTIGVSDIQVHLNSIGCDACRPAYKEALVAFLNTERYGLCEDCKRRVDLNPLRVLDCKNESCSKLIHNAPIMKDFLCPTCVSHNDIVTSTLNSLGIKYIINHKLVRGLDYYSRTVFEFVTEKIGGRQNALGGGGRYDGLSAQLGSKTVPSVGYAGGVERTVMMMEESGKRLFTDIYMAILDENTMKAYLPLILNVKKLCVGKSVKFVEDDLKVRDVKKHLSRADKVGARFALIAGEAELNSKTLIIKDLLNKTEDKVNAEAAEVAGRLFEKIDR